MSETWLPIPGHDGYEVSDLGRVRSVDRFVRRADGANAPKRGRVLKQQLVNSGYLTVHLYAGARRRSRFVHRLVALAFHANPTWLPEVDHVDGAKTNNTAVNLQWVSRQQNVDRAMAMGAVPSYSLRRAVVGVSPHGVVRFDSMVEADIAFSGRKSGNVGHGIRRGVPRYGYMWSLEGSA